jgi:Family of unknown function (DUF6503)
MNKLILPFIVLTMLMSCKKDVQLNAESIISKTIEVAGGNHIATSTIDFDFRDKHYKAIRNNGMFQLEREFRDSIYIIKDVYTNNDFTRFINNDAVVVHDTMAKKYISSVNSVHYFSVLPFGLDGAAVNKTYLGDVNVNGNTYHKIKVTFNQEGGGEDFEDVFVYWINTESYKIDYLAYSYTEDDGYGMRFREAYNERYIKGIRFIDYNNYKPYNNNEKLLDLDRLFENDELKLLSKIETEKVEVN